MSFKTAAWGTATFLTLIFVNFSLSAQEIQPEQADSIYRLPAGTRITLKMNLELSSDVAGVNDTFTAIVSKPVMVHYVIVLGTGTIIQGRVREVQPSKRGGASGKLDVVFESMRAFNSAPRPIEAELVKKLQPRSSTFINVLSVVGGTVIGAVIGVVSKAPAAGVATGAGGGTAIALLRKGKELKIREDEEFQIELKRELVLPVLDY